MCIERLYKGRFFNQFSKQFLSKRELYFAKTSQLNDLYKISVPLAFERTEEQFKLKLETLDISPPESNINASKDCKAN